MQTCIKCKEEKEFNHFYKHKGFKSGFYSTCKKCMSEKAGITYGIGSGRPKGAKSKPKRQSQVRERKIRHWCGVLSQIQALSTNT
jgi:hypothetical protein